MNSSHRKCSHSPKMKNFRRHANEKNHYNHKNQRFSKYKGVFYGYCHGCVIHLFSPHGIEIVHDVNIILNHGKELKAKALPLILFFCSVVRIKVDGLCAI